MVYTGVYSAYSLSIVRGCYPNSDVNCGQPIVSCKWLSCSRFVHLYSGGCAGEVVKVKSGRFVLEAPCGRPGTKFFSRRCVSAEVDASKIRINVRRAVAVKKCNEFLKFNIFSEILSLNGVSVV